MCDCPLCPLIDSNTQLCNVLVRYDGKDVKVTMPDTHPNIKDIICVSIARLAVSLLKSGELQKKQKIGESCDVTQDTYEFNMKRVMKTVWKVCFHTLSKESDPE